MADDCIFCKIAQGTIPAGVVFQDAHCVAFMDINPLSKGHTLLIPTRHKAHLEDLSSEHVSQYLACLPRLVRAVKAAVGAPGATVAWNDGEAAGQEVGHVHLHIIPRWSDDKAGPVHGMFAPAEVGKDEMAAIASSIRRAMGSD